MRKYLFLYFIFLITPVVNGQESDSAFIAAIFEEALTRGKAHPDLKILCKQAGPRLSGSPAAQKAVDITDSLMQAYRFDTVYKQELQVPHWERGDEKGLYVYRKGKKDTLAMCALGGSVAGRADGEVIEVLGYNELMKLNPEQVRGKIVFFNRPMDVRMVYTFNAYGTCVDQRVFGAIWAGALGARGVIVRSMSIGIDPYPHTGTMAYADTVLKIPAIAISTQGAEDLSKWLKEEPRLRVAFELYCKSHPHATSYNVVGQINGKKNLYIALGGHLDAWDLGEGAHDDGAGCIHAIEALRILKAVHYSPQYNLRAVMWMNEENGLQGGLRYAFLADSLQENHLVAIESDRGGFAPRGFFIDGSPEQIAAIQKWLPLLEPYGLHVIKSGGSGADIGPLRNYSQQTVLIGFVPDSQRYFDYHHAATDVWENVNKRELEMGAAALAALTYLLDKYW